MSKCNICINNSSVKSKSLTFMNSYCPCQLERILLKCSDYCLLNLFGFIIESIFHVLPFGQFHPDGEIIVRTFNHNDIVLKSFYFPYFPVKEELIARQIIFCKHNLGAFLQDKLTGGGVGKLR